MSRVAVSEPPRPAQTQPKVFTLEEIEQQMMAGAPEEAPKPPQQLQQQQPPQLTQPPREDTPVQSGLAGSGYASGQALLDSMFPELGMQPPAGRTGPLGPADQAQQPQLSPEAQARMAELHDRLKAKIENMSRYNNLMGSSDKDFITRIQLSQLASADPYTSDFYAQVFSALQRSRMQDEEGPTVVNVTKGFGFGVGGAAGNRFGKMGAATMQKLSSQVKKLVENRQYHQKSMGTGKFSPSRLSVLIH